MRYALFAACLFALLPTSLRAAETPEAPGLGDPGQLVGLLVETGRSTPEGAFVISGRDASQQLIVTGRYDSGQLRDLSRKVKYTVAPEGIVAVDATGHVTPQTEGQASIHVQAENGPDATVQVTVTNIIQDLPVNFPNQVTPIFTKYGCNGGGCHGKSGGQNGFRLSLLGFEPTEDYEFLVK